MKRTLSIMAACALCIPSAAYISACSPQEEERSIYTITAAYDGADTLTGSVELNYLNDTENALDCLKFNLWGNAFREGAKHPAAEGLTSSSCGGMEITEVRGGTWSVGGEDENILEVVLGEPLYPDMRVSVGIDFKLDLAQADARTGVTEHTVNLGNFYPVLCAYGESGWLEYTYSQTGDPFVSETADYAVELTIPQGYTAAASGAAAESAADGENVTLSYRLENARDFAAVLSQQFSVAERDAGGIAVLAHPAFYDNFDEIEKYRNMGLDGIEVWHPSASKEQIDKLTAYCKTTGLLMTGGSDFHGIYGPSPVTIGSCTTPQDHVEKLLGYKAKKKRAQRKAEKQAAMQNAAVHKDDF